MVNGAIKLQLLLLDGLR